MLFFEGMCVLIVFLALVTKNLRKQQKVAIVILELGACLGLGAPLIFLTYEGMPGKNIWWLLRFSKFLDYMFPLVMLFAMNLYLKDLFTSIENKKKIPVGLKITDAVLLVALILIFANYFTGFYYTIGSDNIYYRGKGRFIATVILVIVVFLQIFIIIPKYKKIPKNIYIPIVLFLASPIFAAIVQLFMHGVCFTNISIVNMSVVLYIFVIHDMNVSVEKAHRLEVELLENYQKELEHTVEERTRELRVANEKAEHLLLNILPKPIALELTENPGKTISQNYPNSTILFTDIVGFTKMSSEMSAEETVDMLNNLVSHFDRRAQVEGIEKIKTIGDAYMAASGLTAEKNNDGAEKMIHFAKGLLEDVVNFNKTSDIKIQIRVGINSGNLVAGVIGKTKFIYDVWGDTVNVASRMESTGVAMKIHVSESTYSQVKNSFAFEGPVEVEVKGKGLMSGYFLS